MHDGGMSAWSPTCVSCAVCKYACMYVGRTVPALLQICMPVDLSRYACVRACVCTCLAVCVHDMLFVCVCRRVRLEARLSVWLCIVMYAGVWVWMCASLHEYLGCAIGMSVCINACLFVNRTNDRHRCRYVRVCSIALDVCRCMSMCAIS